MTAKLPIHQRRSRWGAEWADSKPRVVLEQVGTPKDRSPLTFWAVFLLVSGLLALAKIYK